MNTEDKELLLKDLCARLPYGVKCADFRYDENGEKVATIDILEAIYPNRQTYKYEGISAIHHISRIKPYLRPFKSMTKDERSEYYKQCKSYHYRRTGKCGRNQYGETLYKKEPMSYTAFYRTPEALDYLNSIHVDYRGLIKKGLALEAPEGMYK